jgi:hypothetical protein
MPRQGCGRGKEEEGKRLRRWEVIEVGRWKAEKKVE